MGKWKVRELKMRQVKEREKQRMDQDVGRRRRNIKMDFVDVMV